MLKWLAIIYKISIGNLDNLYIWKKKKKRKKKHSPDLCIPLYDFIQRQKRSNTKRQIYLHVKRQGKRKREKERCIHVINKSLV